MDSVAMEMTRRVSADARTRTPVMVAAIEAKCGVRADAVSRASRRITAVDCSFPVALTLEIYRVNFIRIQDLSLYSCRTANVIYSAARTDVSDAFHGDTRNGVETDRPNIGRYCGEIIPSSWISVLRWFLISSFRTRPVRLN